MCHEKEDRSPIVLAVFVVILVVASVVMKSFKFLGFI